MGIQVTVSANQIDKERLGYSAISLDSLIATTAVTIKAGSKVEVGGALYEFTVDETESGGTFAAISVSTPAFMYVVPAGAATTWIYSSTAPAWDVAKQGWYNGSNRCLGGLFKDAAGTGYIGKWLAHPVGALGQTLDITTGAGNVTENLPPASSFLGAGEIDIFKADSGAGKVVVTANGGDLINGYATWDITDQYGHVRLKPITGGWRVVSCSGTTYTLKDVTSRNQSSATSDTWYNIGSLSIALPAGVFDVTLQAGLQLVANSLLGLNCRVSCTLSTANNSETDADWTTYHGTVGEAQWNSLHPGLLCTVNRQKRISVASPTTYYVNERETNDGAVTIFIVLLSDFTPLLVVARRVG